MSDRPCSIPCKTASPAMASRLSPHKIEELPQDVRARIYSLASTPSCPAPVLLACTSKAWGAATAALLTSGGASITLSQSFADVGPMQQQDKEVERLAALATWMRRRGHLLTELTIQPTQLFDDILEPFVYGVPQPTSMTAQLTIPGIMDALAAAGRRPGGLSRLQQLHVPALGNTPLSSICAALGGCRQLRELHLSHLKGSEKIFAPEAMLREQLPAVLRQLTQLTSLHMDTGLFSYEDPEETPASDFPNSLLDELCGQLPSSLVELHWTGLQPTPKWQLNDLMPSTLYHLKALERLQLPRETVIYTAWEGNDAGLAALPALTSLVFHGALQHVDTGNPRDPPAVLKLPNQLVHLEAEGVAEVSSMEALATNTALRSLGLKLPAAAGTVMGPLLSQMTRLTRLRLLMYGIPGKWNKLTAQNVASTKAYRDAVGALLHLRCLAVTADLLQHLDLRPLSTLTHLQLEPALLSDVRGHHPRANTHMSTGFYSQEHMCRLLGRLAPLAGSQLQQVVLVGVPAEWHGACCAAVAAALGSVKVAFM